MIQLQSRIVLLLVLSNKKANIKRSAIVNRQHRIEMKTIITKNKNIMSIRKQQQKTRLTNLNF